MGQIIASIDSPPETSVRDPRTGASVRLWLYGLAVLVMVMVAVGGATRLTGSGLSITEWKPVTGAIPPLSDAGWAAEFEKYRASSQYQNLNRGMALGEFKVIYWWEWSHRQLGRFLGFYFFLPLVWFWWRGNVSSRLALTLVGIGALGGLQAMVGWIMVASGLEPGMTAVAPIKLMLHLVIASMILAAIVWVAAGLRAGEGRAMPVSPGLARAAVALVALILVQIALGGLVAGSRAGWTYNTWPLMDGHLVPPAAMLFSGQPWIENFADNPILVQFNHRLVAYLLVAAALWHAYATRRTEGGAMRAGAVAGLTLAQAGLGIVTLLLVVPLWAGLAHQLLAMVLLMVATHHARLCRAA
ncbi:cytochrome c oxidase assembly protein subunit 15 [Enterovirga rhinocerotis]|uniref:Heme A synthase n=1 Tax=Enterovirga rhinocerotis TaxID=1339210 RepID=A0A4R7C937_9HYPH|nr:cytochrome c oxidase assembly protein subunit 15 [Enterovirga rhinocerotis]